MSALTTTVEQQAQTFAASHNFCIETLSFEYGRYQFGSLAECWNGKIERAIRFRALCIAREREITARMSEAA